MNKHDRDNLLYILGLSDEQFDEWASELSEDDIQYATEILRQARQDLVEQEQALTEAELMDSNFAEANAVLKKFML